MTGDWTACEDFNKSHHKPSGDTESVGQVRYDPESRGDIFMKFRELKTCLQESTCVWSAARLQGSTRISKMVDRTEVS